MDTLTFSSALTVKRDSTAQVYTFNQAAVTLNLGIPAELDASQKTLSTSYQALDFDEVSFSDLSWGAFRNTSSTAAEIVTLSKLVGLSDGFSEDATPTVGGGAVPATLPAAGKYRTISSDGTSQGINWKTGDRAVYLGSSGVYGRIPLCDIIKIPAQYSVALPFVPDGFAWYAKSASGTPQLAWAVAGALA